MPGSQALSTILRRHLANELLQAPTLLPMQRSHQDLSADQPAVPPDPAILDSAARALEAGETHYVDTQGIPPLRDKLAGYLRSIGLPGYDTGSVLVTAGVQECRFLSIQVAGELFGAIGLPAVVHPGARQAAGVRHVDVRSLPVDPANGLLPTLRGMHEALADGCKVLYLESPVRLTGAAYGATAVKAIATLVEQFGGVVIWDQGLSPWLPDGYSSLAAAPDMAERTVIFGEAWPGVGLESWFIGYLATRADWMSRLRSQKQIMAICTSTPSQFAALKTADVYASIHSGQRELFARLRDAAVSLAVGAGAQPLAGSAANVLALQVSDADRTTAALRNAGFECANGADFGAPSVVRLAVTPDNAIADALATPIKTS